MSDIRLLVFEVGEGMAGPLVGPLAGLDGIDEGMFGEI